MCTPIPYQDSCPRGFFLEKESPYPKQEGKALKPMYALVLASTSTDRNEVHPAKVPSYIVDTVGGMTTVTIELQPRKLAASSVITDPGMAMCSAPAHSKQLPHTVTFSPGGGGGGGPNDATCCVNMSTKGNRSIAPL